MLCRHQSHRQLGIDCVALLSNFFVGSAPTVTAVSPAPPRGTVSPKMWSHSCESLCELRMWVTSLETGQPVAGDHKLIPIVDSNLAFWSSSAPLPSHPFLTRRGLTEFPTLHRESATWSFLCSPSLFDDVSNQFSVITFSIATPGQLRESLQQHDFTHDSIHESRSCPEF